MLTERLREFVEAGLVERTVDPGPPITSTYRLTDSGERFRHIWTDLRDFARDDAPLSAAS
jgi:DNA-binding HxlR family transcriptional regulator